ncbi:MAG: glutamate--tRNA ligase [Coriobacteriia bacterium]|nr:glutamate--tRNA ligase [Coriobacteriia bacterium]
MSERVRFAPSPTGGLHLGGARTALYNWLLARATGGAFILRIEDTNAASVVTGAEEAISSDLAWLGLTWDEGPDVGGPHAPYRQSERQERYRTTFARLRGAGFLYPCFCTTDQLAVDRSVAAAANRPPRYSGRCRGLDAAAAETRIAAGEPHAWRFRVPAGDVIRFVDAVFGDIAVPVADIGDFVLVRSDGTATYDLACVTDDLEMDITTVLRGADHLTNTARQLLIYDALAASAPRFAHLPLVTGPTGSPLSKSGGATTVAALAAAGHSPAAVLQHVAQLGWSDPAGRQLLSADDLIASFSLDRVSVASAVHDPARLASLTTRHLHALPHAELLAAVRAMVPDVPEWLDLDLFVTRISADLARLSDVGPLVDAVVGTAPADEEAVTLLRSSEGVRSIDLAIRALSTAPGESTGEDLEDRVRATYAGAGLPLRIALPSLRAALTGPAHGLPIALLLDVIPRSVCLVRLERALG